MIDHQPSGNSRGAWHLRVALTLIFCGLLLATGKASWQGWNLLGNLAGFTVGAAILACVYLGNRLWIWFVRIVYGLFYLMLIAACLTTGLPSVSAILAVGGAYVLWVLYFSKSVKQHWLTARKT
jgi:hypothetical protein